MALEIAPISLRAAQAFVAEHHRHNVAPRGWLFGAALILDGDVVAVAIAGRPVARGYQDGRTVEILRVCIAPEPRLYVADNAASRLYGALCRAAAALGYQRAVSYTLESESGTSLRASGFASCGVIDQREQRTWASAGRPRYSSTIWGQSITPDEKRIRWERVL